MYADCIATSRSRRAANSTRILLRGVFNEILLAPESKTAAPAIQVWVLSIRPRASDLIHG